MTKKTKYLFLAIILAAMLVAWFLLANNKVPLRVCPDAWYDNRMPGSSGDEYLVIDGKRAELKNYDINWIKANCEIKKPQPVY